jgi:hypothetical protein
MHPHEHARLRVAGGGAPSHDPDTLQPLALPLSKAVQVTGLSRSAIYRAAGDGAIVLLKVGRSTLVEMNSARAFIAGLPRAEVGRRQAGG